MRKLIILATIIAVAISANARILKKSKKNNEKAQATEKVEYKPVTDVLSGEWIIKTVGTTTINREENAPYIYFVTAEDAFYASNGCNVLNGIFTIEDGYKITFHNVMATMRYCHDTPYDSEINSVLSDEKTVLARYESIAGEGYLYLADANGRQVMTLHRHALDFLNGNWRVTEINGESFDDDEMTIFFDIAERKVHGNTGCNFFNGNIYIDPNGSNAISLSEMGVTRRACPNLDRERKMLVGLEQTSIVVNGENGTALLTDKSGSSVIKLVRMPAKTNTGND